MTALSGPRETTILEAQGVLPGYDDLPVLANVVIYPGAAVVTDSSGWAKPAVTSATVHAQGISLGAPNSPGSTVDSTGLASGAVFVRVQRGAALLNNSAGGDEITKVDYGSAVYFVDDQTVAKTDDTGARSVAGICYGLDPDGTGQVVVVVDPALAQINNLASLDTRVTNAEGDIDDLETDVANLQTDAALGTLSIPLTAFREVNTSGAVGNIAGGCGNLASDTTPVLGAEATTEAMSIQWAAGNSDIIAVSISLPSDFDGGQNALLDLDILTDNTGGGGIEAGTFSVLSGWTNGSQVTDTATDGTPATTIHTITATIAAADIPASPTFVNLQLVLGTHANDPIHLLGARLRYSRVIT